MKRTLIITALFFMIFSSSATAADSSENLAVKVMNIVMTRPDSVDIVIDGVVAGKQFIGAVRFKNKPQINIKLKYFYEDCRLEVHYSFFLETYLYSGYLADDFTDGILDDYLTYIYGVPVETERKRAQELYVYLAEIIAKARREGERET